MLSYPQYPGAAICLWLYTHRFISVATSGRSPSNIVFAVRVDVVRAEELFKVVMNSPNSYLPFEGTRLRGGEDDLSAAGGGQATQRFFRSRPEWRVVSSCPVKGDEFYGQDRERFPIEIQSH